MKTLQKYTNIALFLISATAMIPAHANSNVNAQEQVEQGDVIVETQNTYEYKQPTRLQRIGEGLMATVGLAAVCACLGYVLIQILKPISQDPFDIRLMNANIETKKLMQNYKDLLQMNEATVWELPATHKADLLKTMTAIYNKYGIKSKNELYTLVDGSLVLKQVLNK